MKSLIFVALLFCSENLCCQRLSEINFTYRVPEWDSHLTGQFASITNSSDGNTVFAAAYGGGIFRSTDGGLNFIYLKSFPSVGIRCIRYIERSTPILIVTVEDLWLSADRRSLIWYSTDRGSTWNRSSIAALPLGYTSRPSAGSQGYDIDYNTSADIIYVATDYGLVQSTDGGASFTHRENITTMPRDYKINPTVFSVKCGQGSKVYMAGTSGFYYSSDGGINWTRYALPITPVASYLNVKNLIATVPGTNTILLVVSKYYTTASPTVGEYVYWSNDNGSRWTNLSGTPTGDGGCGGRPSVKCKRKSISGQPDSCVVYISNRCQFFRKTYAITATNTVDFSNSAAWTQLNQYHDDSHEITFRNESSGQDNPLYLSTDGGLQKFRSGIDFPLISSPYRGLNALLIYDLTGQTTRTSDGSYIHTVYFGTQDNKLGYFTDGLPPYNAYPVINWEGRGLETNLYGGVITYTAGSPYYIYSSAAKYQDVRNFNNCPGNIFWPYYIKEGCYVQLGVPPGSEPGTMGVYLTKNNGRNWWLLYSKTGDQPRVLKVVKTSSSSAIIYMPVLNESGKQVFVKILAEFPSVSIFGIDISVPYAFPVMPSFTGFGSLGFTQWESTVFAINPSNPEHIIAPDMASSSLKQSFDGGNTWSEIPGLTRRLLGEGQFNFRYDQASFISSVGFSPSGQNIVVGTTLNGLFYSTDRGLSWARVENSESLRFIYQPYFKPALSSRENVEEIFIPTHGRGIWKLELPRNPTFYYVDIPYWRYYYRQPRDLGLITDINTLNPAQNKTSTPQDRMILFHPDSVRSVMNTPNGIMVTLEENAEVYDPRSGFVPLNLLQIPGLAYPKKGTKSVSAGNNSNKGEKIAGLAIYQNKIIALITAYEKAPYFASAKEKAAALSKNNAPVNEKKLNQYKDRFLVSEVNTGQGRGWQLNCCNIDTRNGTSKDFTVRLDGREFTSFTINKTSGCTPVVLSTGPLPPGRYRLEITPKGSTETVGTASFEVRPGDKK